MTLSASHADVQSDPNKPGIYRVAGALTVNTVAAVETPDFKASNDGIVHVDMSAVRIADSAAVALMLGWVEQIRDSGSRIRFEAVPEPLQALVRIAGLTDLVDMV